MSYQDESPFSANPVRPGEQWFFYWKTSASLWETRIKEIPDHEIIFIPLYWGFHAEGKSSWDFGKYHPERDLKRLVTLLTQYGRRFCWLLPLTPVPFLPNGGIPTLEARTLATSPEGLHLASFDQENTLNKMYSFFGSKVFQNFSSFLKAFMDFLIEQKVESPIWGVDFKYFNQGQEYSFIQDGSVSFEQGFSRYLKSNYPKGVDINAALDEEKLKASFTKEVWALFETSAKEILAPFWQGTQSIHLLGASPQETIERSLETGKSQLAYFKDIFSLYTKNQWFSTALLTSHEKKDLLRNCLEEHFGSETIEERYLYQVRKSYLNVDFRPLNLIDIFQNFSSQSFDTNGLMSFLKDHYRWLYHSHQEVVFSNEWIESSEHKIKFFEARGLDRTRFGQMLKLFLMGQKVVLDISELDPELEKRLQVFYLENNLKVQSVNFQTMIHLTELGEGRFITFEGKKLQEQVDKSKFWFHLFKFFNLRQPKLVTDDEVFSLWRIRETSPHELNYLDVRRVSLYNPTSYKKLVMVQTQKQFAFLKMIDPYRANAKSTPDGVEVELLPNGKIALDFGHYEEV